VAHLPQKLLNMFENLQPWMLAIIVLISQTIFLWLRTLNVLYTTRLQVFPAILTGLGIGITWLIGIAIGVSALLEFEILPILGHLLGGAIGTYMGLIKEKKKQRKYHFENFKGDN
jgi:hypothetical protein